MTTKIINHLILFLIFISFINCGNLKSIHSKKSPLFIKKNDKVSIEVINCNKNICKKSNGDLHKKVKKIIKEFVKENELIITNNKNNVKCYFYLISAFEEKIEPWAPRNLYFIIKDNNMNQISQFAIAEQFSSVLNHQHIEFNKIEDIFKKKLNQSFFSFNSLNRLVKVKNR